MRRIIVAYVALCGAFFLALTAIAQVPQTGAGLAKPAGGGGGFVGPGDIVASPKAFWSIHSCVTAAYSGNVAKIVDAAGGGVVNTSNLACSGGTVTVTGSSLATTCATSCFLDTVYNQMGNTCDGATNCDMVWSSSPTRPQIVKNAIGANPCVNIGVGASATYLNALNTFTQAQPLTVVSIAQRNSAGGTGNFTSFFEGGNQIIRTGWTASANTADYYNGSSVPTGATASDDALHDLAYVMANATQSVIYVDGTGTNQSLGSATGYSAIAIQFGTASSSVMTGIGCEVGVWGSDIGSTNAATLSTNARTRWGSF